jgi:predicted peptidase
MNKKTKKIIVDESSIKSTLIIVLILLIFIIGAVVFFILNKRNEEDDKKIKKQLEKIRKVKKEKQLKTKLNEAKKKADEKLQVKLKKIKKVKKADDSAAATRRKADDSTTRRKADDVATRRKEDKEIFAETNKIIEKINSSTWEQLLENDLFFDINKVNIDKVKDKLYKQFSYVFNKKNEKDNLTHYTVGPGKNWFYIRNNKLKNYNNKIVKQKYGFSRQTTRNGATGKLPIYICLHGGGASTSASNDTQWKNMKTQYRFTFDTIGARQALLIWPRGIVDQANTHYAHDSYSLLDKLIVRMAAKFNGDLNRVYLIGFSAGGDGVYSLSTRNLDMFSAVNMNAGHSNNLSLKNLKNIPILLQMGVLDNAYDRMYDVLKKYKELKDDNYKVDLFINAYNVKYKIDRWTRSSGKPRPKISKYDPEDPRYKNFTQMDWLNKGFDEYHNITYNKDNKQDKNMLTHSFLYSNINYKKNRMVYAIKDVGKFATDFKKLNENLKKNSKVVYNKIPITRYKANDQNTILKKYYQNFAYNKNDSKYNSYKYIKNKYKKIVDNNIHLINANSVIWLNKYRRDPYPNHIILNGNFYATRQWTPGLEITSKKMTKRFNLQYWLDFSVIDLPTNYKWGINSGECDEKCIIEAKVTSKNNVKITLPDEIKKVKILFNDKKHDLSKKININGKSYQPKPNLKIMVRTLLERGDPDYIFMDEYIYEQKECPNEDGDISKGCTKEYPYKSKIEGRNGKYCYNKKGCAKSMKCWKKMGGSSVCKKIGRNVDCECIDDSKKYNYCKDWDNDSKPWCYTNGQKGSCGDDGDGLNWKRCCEWDFKNKKCKE